MLGSPSVVWTGLGSDVEVGLEAVGQVASRCTPLEMGVAEKEADKSKEDREV